jgi:2-(1,2-epoxy-1,2-dihydrophenyl)acetyl-CoA isomerase
MGTNVLYEKRGKLVILTLNRPTVFNSFNREMALELQQHLQTAAEDQSCRAVLITGNGKAFCAGQDLGEVTGPNPPGFEQILGEHYNPIIRLIRNLEKPVIAAVNGVAAGAGANIALACDIVIASDQASFIQAFSKIGLIPDSGGTYFLPRMIGFQKAAALMMTGDKVSATEAERMGMVYKVLPAEGFLDECWKFADVMSDMPTRGIVLTKQALNYSLTHNLEQQLQIEEQFQIAAGNTHDYHEGVNAFMEKRKPLFKGE